MDVRHGVYSKILAEMPHRHIRELFSLSTAEYELHTMVKASAESMGFQSAIRAWDNRAFVYSDASAALCVIQRQGLGRFLFRAELERAEGCPICKCVGERQFC